MADTVPWWPTTRLDFHDHQPIYAEDLIVEQEFHLGQRRRGTRSLRTAGIAEGFVVSAKGTIVIVNAGSAFDTQGNVIVLAPSTVTNNGPLDRKRSSAWLATQDPIGGWQRNFLVLPEGLPPDGALVYVQFCETQQYGPNAQDPNLWQQTPIIDYVNPGDFAYLAGVAAVVLGTLRVNNDTITIEQTAQLSGLQFPGATPEISHAGALPTVATYVRPRPASGAAPLEIGGQNGVVVGMTRLDAPPDPMTGVAPLTSVLSVGSNHEVAFQNRLTVDGTVSARGSALHVDGELLTTTPAGVGVGAVSVGGALTIAPASSPSLKIAGGNLELATPTVAFSSTVGAAAGSPGVRLGSGLYAGAAAQFLSQNQQTRFGFVKAAADASGLAHVCGSDGVAVGLSAAGVFTSALAVGASRVTARGALTFKSGNLVVPGGATSSGDMTVGGLVSSRWTATLVIDNELVFDKDTHKVTSLPFTSNGGALIIFVLGTLICKADTYEGIIPTAPITVAVDGNAIQDITASVQFGGKTQGFGSYWATLQLPATRLLANNIAAGTLHTLSLAVPGNVPLAVAASGGPQPTQLYATVIELPVASASSGGA